MDGQFFAMAFQYIKLSGMRNACLVSLFAISAMIVGGSQSVSAEHVQFDAPAIVIAEAVNPAVVSAPLNDGHLMRLRIPLSTLVSQDVAGGIEEYTVAIRSPQQSMRVIDFWPKDEYYTDIDGNVEVASSEQLDRKFGFDFQAAYEPVGRGSAGGDYQTTTNRQENYQRRPPMQILTSSGTIDRGFGCFFKFRPGPFPVLEGTREVAILFEVSSAWRADMLQVSMRAVGKPKSSSKQSTTLGSQRLWMATHREGDSEAARQTRQAMQQERQLRALAASSQEQVMEKSLPTFLHKVGAQLDLIQPRIPDDYLSQIIFGSSQQIYQTHNRRLPVDLRVAMLDYLDQRDKLLNLAEPRSSAQERVMAKPVTQD
jgi:hypothetical protein